MYCYVLFLILSFRVAYCKNAFASTLTSDSFLLAAKVLGYSIRKHHVDAEYVIIHTEEVSNDTVDALNQHNITTRLIKRLDTPYVKTHTGNKYQYTKIHLWSLVEYETLFHVDLDAVLLDNVEEVFKCGNFCASLRHSDMFNAGVFVLTPNVKVYQDLLNKMHTMSSYDGGDQGFFNNYFWQLKYSEMLGNNNSKCNQKIRRLSSIYNFDVGMYYASGHMLLTPKIIHYTLGPIKPWYWFGYPIFDLNWKWNEVRLGMHQEYKELTCEIYSGLLSLMLTAIGVVILHFVSAHKRYSRILKPRKIQSLEKYTVICGIILIGVVVGYYNTPDAILPQLGWLHYTAYLVLSTSTVNIVYSRYRRCNHYNMMSSCILSSYFFVFYFLAWFLLVSASIPVRYVVSVIITITYIICTSFLLHLFLFYQNVIVENKKEHGDDMELLSQ